jgi:hypothetical protein
VPTASRYDVLVVAVETLRPRRAIPPKAASSDELFGPFSEAAFGSALIRFNIGVEHTRSGRIEVCPFPFFPAFLFNPDI